MDFELVSILIAEKENFLSFVNRDAGDAWTQYGLIWIELEYGNFVCNVILKDNIYELVITSMILQWSGRKMVTLESFVNKESGFELVVYGKFNNFCNVRNWNFYDKNLLFDGKCLWNGYIMCVDQ